MLAQKPTGVSFFVGSKLPTEVFRQKLANFSRPRKNPGSPNFHRPTPGDGSYWVVTSISYSQPMEVTAQ
jgi:hypothetical protein